MNLGDLGEFKPTVELAGQIVSAGIALGAIVTGKKFIWAPKADGLPHYAARVFGVVNGIGLAYLWTAARNCLTPRISRHRRCICSPQASSARSFT